MTISPTTPLETEDLVKPKKIFYPARISIRHYQLRHLVTSPEPNCIYYANLKNVYKINTKTKKKTHVTELPFEAYCTATGHGWFCAGGDQNSYFAAFRIPEGAHSARDLELDGSGNPDRAVYSSLLDQFGPSHRSQPPRIRIERLGEHIYNSISIHRLCDANGQDDVVAIITNNDQTVRMYSLTKDTELRVEEYDFNMNHATVSPNGKFLAIVGDKEHIFFYRRMSHDSSRRGFGSTANRQPGFEWEKIRSQPLYKPKGKDKSAYFTTAWSPNGSLLATASEEGYITVFDVDPISRNDPDNDGVLMVTPSAKPDMVSGAVRTMCFAPDPWDLLIWAEGSERLCVGDLRHGLQVRQIVHLDPRSENVTTIDLHETSSLLDDPDLRSLDLEVDLLRRQRQAAANMDAFNDRMAGQRRSAVPYDEFSAFTEREWQILDGIRTTRQRQRDERAREGQGSTTAPTSNQSQQAPRSVNYNTDNTNSSPNPFSGSQIGDLTRLRQEAAALGSLRDLRESTADLRQQRIRRRNSAVYVPGPLNASASSADPSLPGAVTTLNSAHAWGTIASALPSTSTTSDPDAGPSNVDLNHPPPPDVSQLFTEDLPPTWPSSTSRDQQYTGPPISTANRSTLLGSASASADAAGANRRELQRDDMRERERERERLRQLARERHREELRRHYRVTSDATRNLNTDAAALALGVRRINQYVSMARSDADEQPGAGLQTTGCVWAGAGSEGEDTLFVGTEEGVFELKMNYEARKYWPAVEPR